MLAIRSAVVQKKAVVQASGVQAPGFEVDPFWPKPLPNHCAIGMTIGVSADVSFANNPSGFISRRSALIAILEAGEFCDRYDRTILRRLALERHCLLSARCGRERW